MSEFLESAANAIPFREHLIRPIFTQSSTYGIEILALFLTQVRDFIPHISDNASIGQANRNSQCHDEWVVLMLCQNLRIFIGFSFQLIIFRKHYFLIS